MPGKIIRKNHTHVLYAPDVLKHIDVIDWFESAAATEASIDLPDIASGRVAVRFFHLYGIELVLKQYIRGGFITHFSHNHYLYLGEWAVRSFSEWYLLDSLFRRKLPVPRPVAARYRREGRVYTAELITVSCRPAKPLSRLLTQRSLAVEEWLLIGSTIKSFHRAGVYHADLNAHNILLNTNKQCFLIDFDRGARRRMAHYWHIQMLNRLHQSLRKLNRTVKGFHFGTKDWKNLMRGYIQ